MVRCGISPPIESVVKMKVFLHFGFPKTMSSTLQFGLFKPLHERGILNLRTWRQDLPDESLDRRPSSKLFNRQMILDDTLDFRESVPNVLSDESLTAPTRLRRNNYGDGIANPIYFPRQVKQQICAKYGSDIDFVPFIVVRNQADLIFSQYVEEYNLKKYKGVDILFDQEGEIDLTGYGIYNFGRYIRILEETFGPGMTKVYVFEEWKRDFASCCGDLSELLEVDLRLIKDYMGRSHVNKKKRNSKGYFTRDGTVLVPYLTELQRQAIQAFFEEDNRDLQGFLGETVNLSENGYF